MTEHWNDPVRNVRLTQGRRLLNAAERLLAVPPASAGELYARWWALFGDDAETVQRAANNLLYFRPISDANVAAAAAIGERIVSLLDEGASRGGRGRSPSDSDWTRGSSSPNSMNAPGDISIGTGGAL